MKKMRKLVGYLVLILATTFGLIGNITSIVAVVAALGGVAFIRPDLKPTIALAGLVLLAVEGVNIYGAQQPGDWTTLSAFALFFLVMPSRPRLYRLAGVALALLAIGAIMARLMIPMPSVDTEGAIILAHLGGGMYTHPATVKRLVGIPFTRNGRNRNKRPGQPPGRVQR